MTNMHPIKSCLLVLLLEVSFSNALRLPISDADQLEQFDPSKDFALIYTNGKVGSTSIWQAFGKLAGKAERDYAGTTKPSYKRILKTHRPEVAADFINKAPSHANIWVMTSVRQPYTRLISAFFERVENGHLLSKERVLNMTMPELHQAFLDQLPAPSRWFDDFDSVTGMNFTKYPFPENDGKLVVSSKAFSEKNVKVVLLRLEDVQQWDQIMSQHVVGWQTPHGQNPDDTWFADTYKEFLQTFTYSKDVAKKYAIDDNMHFYTDIEQAAFLQHAVGEFDFHRQAQAQMDPLTDNFVEFGGRPYFMYGPSDA